MSPRTLLIIVGCLLLSVSVASAHARLESPAPRSLQDDISNGPCGSAPRTAPRVVWQAGSEVTVSWLENVDHPGHWAMAIAPANDTGFEQNVIDANIADRECTAPPCTYSYTFTVPNINCENCTLQLIEWMDDLFPYHSCSDITITGATLPPDDMPPTDNPDDAPMDSEGPADATPSTSGGCNMGGSVGALGLLALIGLALRRRSAA